MMISYQRVRGCRVPPVCDVMLLHGLCLRGYGQGLGLKVSLFQPTGVPTPVHYLYRISCCWQHRNDLDLHHKTPNMLVAPPPKHRVWPRIARMLSAEECDEIIALDTSADNHTPHAPINPILPPSPSSTPPPWAGACRGV